MNDKALTFVVPASNDTGTYLDELKPGDTLTVKNIENPGYSKEDALLLVNIPALVRMKNKNPIGTVVADVVQQIFNHIDQLERTKKRQRQVDGIAAAKAKGVKVGRRPKERPAMLEILSNQWRRGEISAREAGRQLGISHATFLAWVEER